MRGYVSLLALALSISCSTGYQTEEGRVVWVIWNESKGRYATEVPGADPGTFHSLDLLEESGQRVLGVDEDSVFYRAKKIEGADPETFQRMDQFFFYDQDSVFLYIDHNFKTLHNCDLESFKVIDGCEWQKDKKQVYFYGEALIPRDIETFEVIQVPRHFWAKDKFSYYYKAREVIGEDVDTFTIIEEGFGRDRDHIYYQGWQIKEIDPEEFVPIHLNKGKDNEFLYIFPLIGVDKRPPVIEKKRLRVEGEKRKN